jgi:tRNA 2-thiouridine synthesizing protein A
MADQQVDARGLNCPMPIVKTAQAIKELESGQVLEVIADDIGIKSDMPAWCEKTGNECLGFEEEGDETRTFVRKK